MGVYRIPRYDLIANVNDGKKYIELSSRLKDIKLDSLKTWLERYVRKDYGIGLKYFKPNGEIGYTLRGRVLNMEVFPTIAIDTTGKNDSDNCYPLENIENIRIDNIIYRNNRIGGGSCDDLGKYIDNISCMDNDDDYGVIDYILEVNGGHASESTELKDILLEKGYRKTMSELEELKNKIKEDNNNGYMEWFRDIVTIDNDLDEDYNEYDRYVVRFSIYDRLGQRHKTVEVLGINEYGDFSIIKPDWDNRLVYVMSAETKHKYTEMTFEQLFNNKNHGVVEIVDRYKREARRRD